MALQGSEEKRAASYCDKAASQGTRKILIIQAEPMIRDP